MASLARIRYGARVIRRGGREWKVGPRRVWRVRYVVRLAGKTVLRSRETSGKLKAQVLLREARSMELMLSAGAASQDDLQRWLSLGLLRHGDLAGLGYPGGGVTWREALSLYQERAVRLRYRTAQTSLARARDLVAWFADRCSEPAGVTVELVEEWLRWAASQKAAHTVNHTLDVLRQLLDPVFPDGNPARAVQRLKTGRQARYPRALSADEDLAALEVIWEHRDRLHGLLWPFYLVLRFGGLRLSEARYLPRAHVLPGRLLIQEYQLRPEEIAAGDRFARDIWQPKSYEARAVPVATWLTDLLLQLPHSRILMAHNGRVLQRDVAARTVGSLLRTVAPDLTAHCLRHTAITALLEQGHPVPWVQAWAGHREVTTTMRYTHIALEGRQRDTAVRAEQLSAVWLASGR